jgi:predicted dehydrogenase
VVRFGIIGCGAIHGTHADAIKGVEGAQLSGFYDVQFERACGAAEKHDAPAFRSLREFYDNVDAVCVCTPSGLHAKVAIHSARAGKHVVVEKPVDVTLAAAQRMVAEGRKAGVKLTTISQHRFSRQMRRLHDAAQAGDLGKLIEGDAYIKWYRTQQYYDSGDWRGTWKLDGGGCLMNQGVHYVDMIQWVMGGVQSVQAQVRTAAHDIEVEDVATALVQYRNGAIGVIQGSTSFYPGLAERVEVHGEHGTVILEGDKTKVWKVDPERAKLGKYGDGVMQQPTPSLHMTESDMGDADDPTAKWGEQHRLQIEDFVQAIVDDRDPFITGEMSLEPLKVILAIYRSAKRNGARVEV